MCVHLTVYMCIEECDCVCAFGCNGVYAIVCVCVCVVECDYVGVDECDCVCV